MLKLEVWNIVFTIINILLLFVLVRIFLIKPIRKIIAARQAEADEEYNKATAKAEEADALKSKYEAVLSDTEKAKKEVISEARKDADAEYKRIVDSAKDEAQSIKATAVTDAENKKNEIIKSAEKEIADMVVDAAAKVVRGDSQDANSAIYDRFLDKAGDEQ